MRKGNFIGQIFHPSVIEATIKGLFDGDSFSFNVFINGKTQIYKVVVILTEDGMERWDFIRDNTTYNRNEADMYNPSFTEIEDLYIKAFSNSSVGGTGAEYAEIPGVAMAHYVMTYVDALETII